MSDIDFDELDRAVNGATGGNSTPAFKPLADEAPVVSDAPTINRVERTALSPVSLGLPVVPTSASAFTAPAARRSSGRFMDMVHPSSDMRSHIPNAPVENKLERTPEAKPESTVPEIVESPIWNEPLESPFLPDAKVEKRPLGGGEVAAAETGATVGSFDFQGLLDEPEEELLEAPKPQERIEATTPTDPVDFYVATDEIELKTSEVEELVKIEDAFAEPTHTTEQPQLVPEEPIGPTSIIPQYKEQASSNQESGAMYDTESYHQAVTVPIKKKSGWFTVLMILLLIVLGAGGGWAVFTYVLPML